MTSTRGVIAQPVRIDVEPTAARPDESASEGFFLSPRVVDQAAFDHFASRLRQTGDRLAAEREGLRATMDDARAVLTEMREASVRQREQIELAAKLAKAVAQRATDIETAMSKAADPSRWSGAIEEQLEKLVGEWSDRLEQTLRTRAAAVHQDAERKLLTLAASAQPVTDRLQGAVREAERLLSPERGPGLEDLARQIAEASAGSDRHIRALTEAGDRAEDRARTLDQSLERSTALADQVVARQRSLDAALREAIRACGASEDGMRQSLADAREREERLAALLARADDARTELAGATSDLTRLGDKARASSGSILSAVERAERALAELAPWEAVLAGDAAPNALPEPLARIAREFRAELADDLTKMASAMSMIAQRAKTSVHVGPGGAEVLIRSGKDDHAGRPGAR